MGRRLHRVLALVGFMLTGTAEARYCGGTRAAVKLLRDPAASGIRGMENATIAAMRAFRRPPYSARRTCPVECRLYRVHGRIVWVKAEPDGDLHMVLAEKHRTLGIEAPDPRCLGHGALARKAAAARARLVARLNPTTAGHRVARIPVTVEGVGFFDLLHGQRGVAPNGIELHPVTGVEFDGVGGG